MASLSERLTAEYQAALKAGERLRVDALRLIKAEIQRVAIDKRKDVLDDAEIVHVVSRQMKQRRETIEAAKRADRQDILTRATEELAILSSYLPQQLSEDAIRALIDEAVVAVGLAQGPVMKFVMGKAAGAADGKAVSRLVGERLQGQQR